MTPAAMLAIILFAGGGGMFLFAGLSQRSGLATDDPEAYLRSLDIEPSEIDEFQQLLEEPFLTRVLRPLGGRALGGIASILPTNYRDGVQHKLMLAGLSAQYRAEEIITAQVLAAAGMFILALLVTTTSSLSSNQSIACLVGLPIFGALVPNAWLNRK